MSLRNVRILLLGLLALEAALLLFGPQARDHLPAVQSALAAHERPEWWDDAAMGIRYAAWINIALLILLFLTSKQWTRSFSSGIQHPASSIQRPNWFWPLVILATILCLGLRLPLASKSLWWDEAWVVQQVSHGKWRPDPKQADHLKFMAHDWKRCAFYYQKPTNHAPMSLAQKASFNVWRKITGSPRTDFSDLTARAPALIASCAAVILLALLLRSWGRPGAGVLAGLLLAVHPWYIRYGVDARAYALVVPLSIAAMLAITRLVKTRGERTTAWVCWGFIEFLWLWAYPYAVLDVAALNVVALIFLLRSHVLAGDRWSLLFRAAATHLFAAACLIQVFLPNVMQALRWAGRESDTHVLDSELACSTLSQLFLGVEYVVINVVEGSGLPAYTTLPPWNQVICMLLILVMLSTGGVSLWKASRKGACLVLAIVISSVSFALLTRAMGGYFYPRFVIALVPCVTVLAAMAFSSDEVRKGRRWAVVLTALVIAGFGFESLPDQQIEVLLKRPIAPLHDTATFVDQEAAKLEKPPLVACYGLGREVLPVYQPKCLPVENALDLGKLIEQAKAEQRALFVIQGYNFFNRALLGSGFTLLDNRSLFEEVKAFPGIDPEFYFRVFRLK